MPKFNCPHCGQNIDADESLSGITANCPTCSSEIVVPVIQKQLTPPVPQHHQQNSSHNSEERQEQIKKFNKTFYKSCIGAFVIVLFGSLYGPFATVRPDESLAEFTFSGAFFNAIFALVAAVVIASLIALGISAIVAKSYKSSMYRSMRLVFPIVLICVSICIFIASVTRKDSDQKSSKNGQNLESKGAGSILAPIENGSNDDLTVVNIAGLRLRVPRELSTLREKREAGDTQKASVRSYTCNSSSYSLNIKHVISNRTQAPSPVDSAIKMDQNLSDAENYQATKRHFRVGSIDAVILDAHYVGVEQKIDQSFLFFSEAAASWQVILCAVNENRPSDFERIKREVFESIQIVPASHLKR